MIKVFNLEKRYEQSTVLKSINIEINRGEIVGLVGANGAGKTTLIKCLTKFLAPSQGEIFYKEKNIQELKRSEYPIAYIPDQAVLFEELTVKENLQFVGLAYGISMELIFELINKLKLQDYTDILPNKLSKGNKQKLVIGMALLNEFDILIADEPFNGLDPELVAIFKNILLELKHNGKTIILSTHLLDVAETICDRYIIINNGDILIQGDKSYIESKINMEGESSLENIYMSLFDKGCESNA